MCLLDSIDRVVEDLGLALVPERRDLFGSCKKRSKAIASSSGNNPVSVKETGEPSSDNFWNVTFKSFAGRLYKLELEVVGKFADSTRVVDRCSRVYLDLQDISSINSLTVHLPKHRGRPPQPHHPCHGG